MKHITKRTLTLLLAAAMLTTAACGGSDTPNDTTTPSGDTTAADSPYDANGFLKDNLPADLNFGGREVKIYVRGDTLNTEFDTEASGDIVDDAIYSRNQRIEERLGVKLNYFANTSADFWGDRNIFIDTVRTSIMANDGSMDIVAGLSLMMPHMAREGLFFNLNADDMPYLEFNQPWWSESLLEGLAIDDKLYYVSGDASLGVISGMMCMFFNKDLIEQYQLEDPYTLVQDGTWTIDKLDEMASIGYNDLNGNTQVDTEDQYGFMFINENHATNFVTAFGLNFTRQDDNGKLEMALGDESFVDMFARMANMMQKDGISYGSAGSKDTEYINMFTAGRIMFIAGQFSYAAQMREGLTDFGVIPYPKWDEAQDGYYTTPRNTLTGFSIPVTTDKTMASAVLEAMASESYRQVTPAYYETAMKVKYSRDDISSQMFDLIKNGVVYDFATFHGDVLDLITADVRRTICYGKEDWATQWAAKKEKIETLLADFIADIEALEQ